MKKKFHAVIEDSLKINQALFLKPASDEYSEWDPPALAGDFAPRSLIGIRPGDPRLYGRWMVSGRNQNPLMIVNPFLQLFVSIL